MDGNYDEGSVNYDLQNMEDGGYPGEGGGYPNPEIGYPNPESGYPPPAGNYSVREDSLREFGDGLGYAPSEGGYPSGADYGPETPRGPPSQGGRSSQPFF